MNDTKIVGEALTFDDVLLLPGHSQVLPSEVEVASFLAPGLPLRTPLVSAPMDTVTGVRLAIALASLGGIGIIHRNLSIDEQCEQVVEVKRAAVAEPGQAAVDGQGRLRVGAAVGVGEDVMERASALIDAGVDVLVVDSAHGHSQGVIDAVGRLKDTHPGMDVIAGNVATADGARALIDAGADAVRVGVGPGSICTTRLVAGVGVPQLTAVMECARVAQNAGVPVIADGGVRYSGDVVKALAAGASTVMLGGMFAAAEESLGQEVWHDGDLYKAYRGMGSLGAIQEGSDRYSMGTKVTAKLVPEGVEGMVLCQGALREIVDELIGGLRSGMGYVGAADVWELRAKARFMRISSAGLSESHPHDIEMPDRSA